MQRNLEHITKCQQLMLQGQQGSLHWLSATPRSDHCQQRMQRTSLLSAIMPMSATLSAICMGQCACIAVRDQQHLNL
jgi:hypothetical protein